MTSTPLARLEGRPDDGAVGTPMQDGVIERFNGTLRDECPGTPHVQTLAEAQAAIEAWHVESNTARPHRRLGKRTPAGMATMPDEAVDAHAPDTRYAQWHGVGGNVIVARRQAPRDTSATLSESVSRLEP